VTTAPAPATLAQIVAALSVTYTDKGIALWLSAKNRHLRSKPDGNWRCTPLEYLASGHIAEVAEAVRLMGDADASDFVISERDR
jgi:hypothetical protein